MDEFIKYWFQKCSLKLAALQVAATRPLLASALGHAAWDDNISHSSQQMYSSAMLSI
jgi:hypothetical protein